MPAPVTGSVFVDTNVSGFFDAGDIPLAGVTVTIIEGVFNNGYTGSGITDGNGNYSIDSTGMSPTPYIMQAFVNMDYSFCTTRENPAFLDVSPGQVVDFGFKQCCTWFWQSSWVRKACWVYPNGQDNPGQFRLTFIDKKKGQVNFKTFMYPQATLGHYEAIIAAPSKGRWVWQNLRGWGKVLVSGT